MIPSVTQVGGEKQMEYFACMRWATGSLHPPYPNNATQKRFVPNFIT